MSFFVTLSDTAAAPNETRAMPRSLPTALAAALAAALAGLSGCAAPGAIVSGPTASAPEYRVGDRWVYHVEDGYRVKTVWDETYEVTSIGSAGVTVHVTKKGPSTNAAYTEQWSSPGQLKAGTLCNDDLRRFGTPLVRYDFPLADGKSWGRWYPDDNETARATATLVSAAVDYYARVQGWEKVQGYDTIRLFEIMHLDDETFWRTPTECLYTAWYAPSVRGTVREWRIMQYIEMSGEAGAAGRIRTQSAVVELVSFTPGK
jgi:hypothetical protein